MGLLTLTDEGGANFGAIDNGSASVDTGLSTGDDVHFGLFYQVKIGQGGQVYQDLGTVDSSGDLNISAPFSESINPGNDEGSRSLPSSDNCYASGVAGLCIDTGVNMVADYHLVDTNGDGIKDAIDPTAYFGHKYDFTLGVIAPQANGMTQSTIAGNYGSVSLVNLFAAGGDSSVYGEVSKSTADTSGILTHSLNDAVIITRTPDITGTATFTELSDTTLHTGTITVSSDGQFTYTEDGSSASFYGFISSNAEFVVAGVSESEGTAPDFTLANNGISLSSQAG